MNNILSVEKIHTNGAPTVNRMWTNLQTMHESTNRLVLTGYMRNLMVHTPKDVNVTEHLGKLNIHWGQVQTFSVYNQKITDVVYKCIIVSSLPPSWDGFADPYIAGKFDKVSDNPKKMMDSQQFIAIIQQEAERKQLCLIQGGANPIYPEQATYMQWSDNPKPPLYKRIAGASSEPQSQQQSSSAWKHCKLCHWLGHKRSQCWFKDQPKCPKCNLHGHKSEDCRHSKKGNQTKKDKNESDQNAQSNYAQDEQISLTVEDMSENANTDEIYEYHNFDCPLDSSEMDIRTIWYDWMADSGTTSHIIHRCDIFINYHPIPKRPISGVRGLMTHAIGCGDLNL